MQVSICKSVFTLVVICVSIDIDVTESRSELLSKGWDVYFMKAENGGNIFG